MSHIPKIPERDAPIPFGRGSRPPEPPKPAREPMFTMPTSVIVLIAIFGIIHAVRSTLPHMDDISVLAWFAFIPARYTGDWTMLPGGIAADVWTFVTYAFLHGSTMHIVTNAVWMLAFGSAVARRFGPLRFFAFSALCAAGGAAAHLAVHFGDPIPVVGASAAIAGQMAGAARFVFDARGPLVFRQGDNSRFFRPAQSLAATFTNRTALIFIIIWFVVNIAVGLGGTVSGGVSIAWEAHLGGFLMGLLAFRLFDPVPR